MAKEKKIFPVKPTFSFQANVIQIKAHEGSSPISDSVELERRDSGGDVLLLVSREWERFLETMNQREKEKDKSPTKQTNAN